METSYKSWFFDKYQINNSPSRQFGINHEREITYRRNSALFIRDICFRLKTNHSICDTAIVYMHRFYMRYSFTKYQRNLICMSAILLSSKVVEPIIKLEQIIKVAYYLMYKNSIDNKSELYQTWTMEIIFHENLLLRTYGFNNLTIEHPHQHIRDLLNEYQVNEDIIHSNNYFASSISFVSTFCLRFPPRVLACVCVYINKKQTCFMLPDNWWKFLDKDITSDFLKNIYSEFAQLFDLLSPNMQNLCCNKVDEFFIGSPILSSETKCESICDRNNALYTSISSIHHNGYSTQQFLGSSLTPDLGNFRDDCQQKFLTSIYDDSIKNIKKRKLSITPSTTVTRFINNSNDSSQISSKSLFENSLKSSSLSSTFDFCKNTQNITESVHNLQPKKHKLTSSLQLSTEQKQLTIKNENSFKLQSSHSEAFFPFKILERFSDTSLSTLLRNKISIDQNKNKNGNSLSLSKSPKLQNEKKMVGNFVKNVVSKMTMKGKKILSNNKKKIYENGYNNKKKNNNKISSTNGNKNDDQNINKEQEKWIILKTVGLTLKLKKI